MDPHAAVRPPMFRVKVIITTLVVLLVAAAGAAYYFYRQAHIDPAAQAQSELEKTVAQVSRHVVLPQGETPTLATVEDPDKLKDQAFFANAKRGYKVLIYSQSQKAILYDPTLDRIVEIAPVNITGE